MNAAFEKMKWENKAKTIATFYFKTEAPYRYEAGQYAVISVPHPSPDSRGIERTMTLSSSPDDSLVSFTMKIMSSGPNAPRGNDGSSFKQALLDMGPGHEITIREAMGDLVLPLDTNIPLVFVAGGVGIASFTGMTTWLTQHKQKRDIQIYYMVAREEDAVMQTVFDDYAKIGTVKRSLYTPSIDDLPDDWYTPTGRLTADTILASAKIGSLFYISGTESMVEEIRTGLMLSGIARSNIVFDYFDGYSEL
jgi:ferredoxin-NADP reductase